MNFLKKNHHKGRAQAMVEFAIVLPILLLLLYGILETGRFLFIYSSTVTASRQAVRYGSATGAGLTTTSPRYQDCTGIRNAAKAAAYISAIEDADIKIEYDSGPGDLSPITYCNGVNSPPTGADLSDNKHRILVTVKDRFEPILPGIVPFDPYDIEIQSARTVIISVSIEVTPPFTPTYTFTPTFTPTLTFTPSLTYTPSLTPTITQTLQYTYTPSRTPTAAPVSTATPTRTASPIPATPITGCNGALSLGLLTKSDNTMSLSVTNSHTAPLQISVVNVQWNHDKGHLIGNKKLSLQSVILGSSTIWVGDEGGPSYPVTPTSPGIFPAGSTSTLSFTFHQSYDTWDDTESVTINLATPGCEGVVFVQSSHQP